MLILLLLRLRYNLKQYKCLPPDYDLVISTCGQSFYLFLSSVSFNVKFLQYV